MKIFEKDRDNFNYDKPMVLMGHIGFLVYLFFTLIFFKERLINSDAAYYTFHMINFEEVFVKHKRYISYFTQWLPLLLIKYGASLKAVMVSYSFIFGLWFYLLFLINVYLFKSPKSGILLLLALVLTMRYKFYAGHTEITFAIAVATTLYNWIALEKSNLKWNNRWVSTLIVLLFSAWLYIIHPIIIVPLFAMLIYNVIDKNRWFDLWNWGHISMIVFSFILRFISVMEDGYESDKVNLMQEFFNVFSKPKDYYVFKILFDYGIGHINIAIIAFLLSIFVMLKNKKIKLAGFLLVASLGLSILIILSHSYLQSDLYIMVDGYIGMFGMLWGLAILKAIELQNDKRNALILLGALLLICFSKIGIKHSFFEQRHDLQKTLLQSQAEKGIYKSLVKYDRFDWNKLWYPYEFPHETIMLTALDEELENATIFVDYDNKNVDEYLENEYTMLAFYHNVGLNPKFFSLPKQKYMRVDKVPWKD